jgi:hypothetical protein
MKRNQFLVVLALAGILVGAGCNTKSPTGPSPTPTPSTYSVGLVASASSAEVGHAIVLTATVNASGGQKAPDGTGVTFKLTGCVPTSATDPSLDNGGCSEVRTTSAGVAVASVFSSAVTGTFQVVVVVPGTQQAINVRFYNPVNPRTLAIYGITPNQGAYTGGETVTIQGRGFQAPATVDFVVNGTTRHAAVTSVASDGSSLTLTTPSCQFISGASSVAADVTVNSAVGTSDQTSDTLTAGFTFLFPAAMGGPQIYAIVPAQGLVTGGDTVTIYGANFVTPVTVTLGSENAQVASVSADQSTVTLVTPKHSGTVPAAGLAVDVTLTNGANKSVTRTNGWTWLPVSTTVGAPVIYSVSPNKGSPRGGDTVTILGANLCGTVSSTSGQCDSSPTVNFTFTTAPYSDTRSAQVVSVSPDGKTLTILTPQVSPNPVLVDVTASITVTNLKTPTSESVTLANAFTFLAESAPPILYYLQPNIGSCQGGDTVTIYGRYLLPPLKVTFSAAGGNDAQFVSAASDGTSAVVVTPAASSCAGDQVSNVTVVTQSGTGRDSSPVTLASGFTYKGESFKPEIYSLQPNSGPTAGGTRVTIEGTGFMYPLQVFFTVSNRDVQATVVSNNFNEIVCMSPSITPYSSGTPTTAQVRVVNQANGLQSSSLPFYYGSAMFISSIAPNVGPDRGGTMVTIFGQGFSAPVAVSFAGVGASVQSVSGTEIVATTGGVLQRSCNPTSGPVSVTNIDSGTSATSSGNLWTYAASPPVITGVTVNPAGSAGSNSTPGVGATCSNTNFTVTISGLNFEATTANTGPMQVELTGGGLTLDFIGQYNSTTGNISFTTSTDALKAFKFNQVDCTTGGQAGKENVDTPMNVKVTNASNKCTDTLLGGLVVVPCDTICHLVTPLAVACSASTATPMVGQTVNFSATPTGGTPPYTYAWNFGDAGTSTSQNPGHAYGTAGSYTAQVIVTDSLGATATCNSTVTVGADLNVTIVLNGGAVGSVTTTPGGINCTTGLCTSLFTTSPVMLTAAPTTGSFGGWTGDCASCAANLSCSLPMTANPRNCTATFNNP